MPPSPKKVLRKAVINGKDSIFDYEKFEYITTGPKEPHFDEAGTYYDDLLKKYEKYTKNPEKEKYKPYEQYKPFLLDTRESIFANRKDKDLMYVTKTAKPMSGGGLRLNHDYEAMFQEECEKEPEPFMEDYTDLFETEPEPVRKDYTDLFETKPVNKDYTDLCEMEPEPEPEPVVVVVFVEDYTDLFEMEPEPEPVVTDYTDLFETEPEPVVKDYNMLFEKDF